MTIVFSQHALHQLAERNLTQREIKRAVIEADRHIQQGPRRYRAIQLMKKYRKPYCLVVIYDKVNNRCEIVTAFLTSKIKKYL